MWETLFSTSEDGFLDNKQIQIIVVIVVKVVKFISSVSSSRILVRPRLHIGMKDEVLQTCALLTYFRILYLRIP